jgi:hypothetical protein
MNSVADQAVLREVLGQAFGVLPVIQRSDGTWDLSAESQWLTSDSKKNKGDHDS